MNGARPVVEAITEVLEREGSIRFEELMEIALYHPQGGLYRRSAPQRGLGGHFSTCAHVDPGLGRAVARWLEQGWEEELGAPSRWHVIEVGGGDGSLAATVLDELSRRRRRARAGLTYLMVEQGEAALSRQGEKLGKAVTWMPSMVQALRSCRGEALIFSNELVDSFPAVALERRGGRWLEVHLARKGKGLVEELRDHPEWAANELYSVTELELDHVRDGARAEVHRSYRRWLREWADHWRKGWILTIDYGAESEGLYGRGGGGTLRAFYAHMRFDERHELVERLGQQDLTCDVNFTDLRRWGELLGWVSEPLMTQRAFLERFVGLADEARRPGFEFIANPVGAGQQFKVLWQRRG